MYGGEAWIHSLFSDLILSVFERGFDKWSFLSFQDLLSLIDAMSTLNRVFTVDGIHNVWLTQAWWSEINPLKCYFINKLSVFRHNAHTINALCATTRFCQGCILISKYIPEFELRVAPIWRAKQDFPPLVASDFYQVCTKSNIIYTFLLMHAMYRLMNPYYQWNIVLMKRFSIEIHYKENLTFEKKI